MIKVIIKNWCLEEKVYEALKELKEELYLDNDRTPSIELEMFDETELFFIANKFFLEKGLNLLFSKEENYILLGVDTKMFQQR